MSNTPYPDQPSNPELDQSGLDQSGLDQSGTAGAAPQPTSPYGSQAPDPNAAYGQDYGQAYQQPGTQPTYAGYGYPPAVPTQTDRNWASASHWGALVAAWFAMGFLAPLIIMLTAGNDSPFVRKHAVESLNFQISLLIYSAVAVVASIVTLGIGLLVVIPVVLVALVWALVVIIQASVRASNGQDYRYPLTLRLVS